MVYRGGNANVRLFTGCRDGDAFDAVGIAGPCRFHSAAHGDNGSLDVPNSGAGRPLRPRENRDCF